MAITQDELLVKVKVVHEQAKKALKEIRAQVKQTGATINTITQTTAKTAKRTETNYQKLHRQQKAFLIQSDKSWKQTERAYSSYERLSGIQKKAVGTQTQFADAVMRGGNSLKDMQSKLREVKKPLKDAGTHTKTFQQNLHKLRADMMDYAIVAGIVALATKAAWDFTFAGAQINEQISALDRLAARHGTTSEAMIADLRRVSKETITNAQIVRSAGKAMVMGIAPETLTTLMEVATAAARTMGKTADEMFADITLGTARMSKKILDNIGIIVDWEVAYAKHAASIGVTVSMLDEEEKMIARTNAIKEKGAEIIAVLNTELLTQREKLDKVTTGWQNWFDSLKQGFVDIIIPLEGMEKIRKNIGKLRTELKKLQDLQKDRPDLKEDIKNIKKTLAAWESLIATDDKRIKQQAELVEITKRMSRNLNKLQEIQKTLVKESRIEKLTGQYKALSSGLKKALDLSVQFPGELSDATLKAWTDTRDKSRAILGEIAKETLRLTDIEIKKILEKQKERTSKVLQAQRLRQKQILAFEIKSLKEIRMAWEKHYKELEKKYIEQTTKYLDMEQKKKDFLAKILGFRKGIEEQGLSDSERFALAKTKVEEAVLAATNAREENRVELFKRATQAQMDFIGKWQGIRQEGFDAQPFINVETEMQELTRLSEAYKLWAEDAIGAQKSLAEETAREFNRADDAIKNTKEELALVLREYRELVKTMQEEKLETTLDKKQVDDALESMLQKFLKTKAEMEKAIKVSIITTETKTSPTFPAAEVLPPELERGTPRVLRPGLAFIDRNERVLTAKENRNYTPQSNDNRQDNRQTNNVFNFGSDQNISQVETQHKLMRVLRKSNQLAASNAH